MSHLGKRSLNWSISVTSFPVTLRQEFKHGKFSQISSAQEIYHVSFKSKSERNKSEVFQREQIAIFEVEKGHEKNLESRFCRLLILYNVHL